MFFADFGLGDWLAFLIGSAIAIVAILLGIFGGRNSKDM